MGERLDQGQRKLLLLLLGVLAGPALCCVAIGVVFLTSGGVDGSSEAAEAAPSPDSPSNAGGSPIQPASAQPASVEALSDADPRALSRMHEYTGEKTAAGYVPYGGPRSGSLRRGRRTAFRVTLEAGDCYTLAAFGGRRVRDLDMVLVAPSGRTVARDELRDARPVVHTCVQETGEYRARISMFAGRGSFVFQVYRNPGTAARAVGGAAHDATLRRRLDRIGGRLAARGFRPVDGMSAAGSLDQGGVQAYEVSVEQGGSCYAFVAVAGSALREIALFLEDAEGDGLGRDTSRGVTADVERFVARPTAYRVKVHAFRGEGTFAYQVYRRAGRDCDP